MDDFDEDDVDFIFHRHCQNCYSFTLCTQNEGEEEVVVMHLYLSLLLLLLDGDPSCC